MIDFRRFILRRVLPLLAAGSCLGFPRALSGQALTKIMLLGDSITRGYDGSDPVGGFRDDLDSMLVDAGAEFDFVGSQSDGVGFDADHEGHGGWTVDMMLAQIDSFLALSDPDMVLIHLGTNDISANQGVQSTIDQMDQLLTAIYNFKPSMIVHLCAITPRNDPEGPEKDNLTSQLNVGYAGLVFDYRMAGKSIRLVDQNGAFKANPYWQTEYLYDHVHPTNLGYHLMASTYFDTLGSEDIFDIVPPAQITDLQAIDAGPRSVLLRWTATGDDGVTGTADTYDVRYATEPILTPSQYDFAVEAVAEPIPAPSGTPEEFTVGGLDPGVTYYFAVEALDDADNRSPMSNLSSRSTLWYPVLLDDFERTDPGPDWALDPVFILNQGELSNESLEERWDFMGSFVPTPDAVDVSLEWGDNVDRAGVREGGLALMLDAPSPDASGYLIFRRDAPDYYALWTIVDGAPDTLIAQSPPATLPFPGPRDVFQVVVSSDAAGHHFDCYINGVFDTRVSDPAKTRGNGPQLWAGAMLHGNRNNNLEAFTVSGASANRPPEAFALLSPARGDSVETGSPRLDWEDAIDRNVGDTVLYRLSFGTSPVFSPDSTTVVDSLAASEYTVPLGLLAELPGRFPAPGWGEAPGAISRPGEGVLRAVALRGTGSAMDEPFPPGPDLLPDNTVIYWHVEAYDSTGLVTPADQADWYFQVWIPEPPLPFGLIAPLDGDTVGLTPVLSWEASADPDSGDVVRYAVTYDTDSTFQTAPVRISNLETTSFSTPPLRDGTGYWWKVEAEDTRELVTESDEIGHFFASSAVGIGDDDGRMPTLPKAFALGQNFPNPFNPSTSIRLDIPGETATQEGLPVLLRVYDLRGRRIRTLLDEVRAPGRYEIRWDGRDDRGVRVESGGYLYRVDVGPFSSMRKMILLK